MIFLIVSLICSILFGISFKIIAIKKINSLQAILINYVVAGSLGFITTKSNVTPLTVFTQPWSWMAIFLGFVFITSLLVIAETTSKYGISVAQVANRMSVVIPISIAVIFYGDHLTLFKIVGIMLALVAVYLVSHKESSTKSSQKLWWLFPAIIFICSGIIDSGINYAQRHLIDDTNFDAFLACIFSTAFILGSIFLIQQLLVGKQKLQAISIPTGLAMGLLNFGCMYFFVLALNSNLFETSTLFPINNLTVLTLSTVISVLIFKEKLSKKNWLGIALSLGAIIILGFLPTLCN